MIFPLKNVNIVPNLLALCPVLISFLLLYCTIGDAAVNDYKLTDVGAIIDVNSQNGKEEKTAMEVALKNFNNYSKTNQVVIHFHNSSGSPFDAASAAEELIKEKKVQVIIGMETWQEAALVADVGKKAQVPVISFAAPTVTPPLMPLRWPFLIQMANSQTSQMNCIADIVRAYNWRKVIAIYEDDPYSGDSGTIALLSEALQKVDSEIEYRLVLPPFASLSEPKRVVLDEMLNLLRTQSRVFVVLQASLPMVTHLFTEAKRIGLLGRESAWIINESITSKLKSLVSNSVLSSMEGTIGIKTYYSTTSSSYVQFQKSFQTEHIEEAEANSTAGSHALRAYDSITIVTKAIERMNSTNNDSRVFLKEMLSSNFSGLSGTINFKEGQLSKTPIFRVINVVGEKYKELDFWIPGRGFFKSFPLENGKDKNGDIGNAPSNHLAGQIVWPGGLNLTGPKGWRIPTDMEPLRVAVTRNPPIDNFVKMESPGKYVGFCIDLFHEVLTHLHGSYNEYDLPYDFFPNDGSYDDLVDHVIDKTYDAIVGDITILANRSKFVEFTQPYTESGLSMIVPIEREGSAWLFMKPFTWELWLLTSGTLIYTMFVIWFLEHRSNDEFRGPWKNQISTTMWFAFSSLFFAHREKITSNFARVVVVVWLFLVFVLTSSYTASLSSMLTVQRMKSPRDIDWLRENNLPVGYDHRGSFVKDYLVNVFKLNPMKLIKLEGEEDYLNNFQNNNIAAMFIELPYQKAFLNKHCKEYTAKAASYRFGGLGFVFQKGSPLARDFSEAILSLSENGTLKSLEDKWLSPSPKCLTNSTSAEAESLSVQDFWGLYIISGATSTICLILSLLRLQRANQSTASTPDDITFWKKTQRHLNTAGSLKILERVPTLALRQDVHEWSTPRWDYQLSNSDSESQGTQQASHSAEIEIL
ncbi:Glutamate receptor [Quillaja saponaria]|uniref:Glutamate receptor n=1 Tax=Quillaja saponaria TaxID=32244 RepID=A0AAD7P9W5_QUISA|nr:Glutamate receptor [Quillaja saponaria]